VEILGGGKERVSEEKRGGKTGINVIDLLAPYVKACKIGPLRRAGVGKTVTIMSLIHTSPGRHGGLSVRRRRRAHA